MTGLEALKKIGSLYYGKGEFKVKISDLPEYAVIEKELKALDILKSMLKIRFVYDFPAIKLQSDNVIILIRCEEHEKLLKEVLEK